jgi:hypothetical protein
MFAALTHSAEGGYMADSDWKLSGGKQMLPVLRRPDRNFVQGNKQVGKVTSFYT